VQEAGVGGCNSDSEDNSKDNLKTEMTAYEIMLKMEAASSPETF
jgi:hypothetical protein